MIPQRAAQLDARITLERRVEVKDEVGEPIVTWTPYAEVWAHVAPLSGREELAEKQIHAKRTTRISIRFRDDVLATDRIMYQGAPYNIEAILKREFRRDDLTLMASDGLNEG